MMKRVANFKNAPILFFLFLVMILCVPHFLRGEIIGPFDLLVSFYHPFRDIDWSDPNLAARAVHYKNYLQSDAVAVVLPIKLLAVQYIKAGILPLWNPLLMNGLPLFANIQSALLFPTTLLYFIFSSPVAYTISIVLQLLVAFIGMFLFLKKKDISGIGQTIGGMAYALSAYMIVWLPWGTIGYAMAMLPWLLFFIESFAKSENWKYLAGISIATTLCFFAGHTQTSLIVVGTAFLYLFRDLEKTRPILFIVASILIGIGIASIQIIPSYEMYLQSAREIGATSSFYYDQTLRGSSFIQLLFPDFFGNPVTQNWWGKINYAESALYFGSVPLILALYALIYSRSREKFFWGCIAGVGIMTATQNPISYWLYNLGIPVFSSSTFARNSLLIITAGSILAGYGIDDLTRRFHIKHIRLFSSLIAIPLVIGWGLVLGKVLPANFLENIQVLRRNMILNSMVLVATLGGLWLVTFASQKWGKTTLIKLLLIVMTSAELVRFADKYTAFAPIEFFYPTQNLISQLQKKAPARYFQYVQSNTNTVFDIPTVEGSDPLYPKRIGDLAASGNNKLHMSNRAAVVLHDGENKPRLLQLFSAEYLADKQDVYRNSWAPYEKRYGDFDSNFQFLWTDSTYMLYKNRKAVPQASLYYHVQPVKDAREAIRTITQNNFNPLTYVTVETSNLSMDSPNGSGSLTVEESSPTSATYMVTSNTSALLATTHTFYPGWHGYVDGIEQKVEVSNGAFRAIRVPKGRHRVTFKYAPESIKQGLTGSLGALMALLILLYCNYHVVRKTRNSNHKL